MGRVSSMWTVLIRRNHSRILSITCQVKSRSTLVSSHIACLRSKEAGCRWASHFAVSEETRLLFERIANQYRDLADQLELMNKLWPPRGAEQAASDTR